MTRDGGPSERHRGPAPVDLEAYLARIGYEGDRQPTPEVLANLQRAHLARIPFENVDVLLGRRVRLDLESLQGKLVRAGRGGYCFEQNTLFAAMLQAVGFDVTELAARVRPPGATEVLPRTHMTLRIDVADRPWVVDVGFGGNGPQGPVPLDGSPAGENRVVDEGFLHVLQRRTPDGWTDLYSFTLEPAHPADYEVANHYTSTHPDSRFVQTLTVQLSTPDVRHVLRGSTYTVRRGDREETREVAPEELPKILRSLGLELDDEVVDAVVRKVFGDGR